MNDSFPIYNKNSTKQNLKKTIITLFDYILQFLLSPQQHLHSCVFPLNPQKQNKTSVTSERANPYNCTHMFVYLVNYLFIEIPL